MPRLPTLKQKNIQKEQHAAKRSLSVCFTFVFRLTFGLTLQQHAGPIHPDPDATMAVEPTLSSLAALAASSSILESPTVLDPSSSNQQFADPSDTVQTKEQQYRHHIRALHKVIDESDIILLVMDARDPEGCRSRIVEEEVRRRESEGKRLIFVLNKIGEFSRPWSSCHRPSNIAQTSFHATMLRLGFAIFGIQPLLCRSVQPPPPSAQTFLRLQHPPSFAFSRPIGQA